MARGGVVPELQLEVLIKADVLASHRCSLLYLNYIRKRLLYEKTSCPNCDHYRQGAEKVAVQGKLVNQIFVRL